MLIACLLGLTLCGCAASGPVTHKLGDLGNQPDGTPGTRFWWAYRFKIFWPPDADPDFAVDLLLARSVVQPTLREYEGKLTYWRFHRRAAHDATGHQFSLLFYADPDTAKDVFRGIGENQTLREALKANIVEKVVLDDPARPSRPRIEDSSDPSWSPPLQRSWPSFIMGASALWLGLINDFMAEGSEEHLDVRTLLEHYREANTRVTSIWYKEGQHAFLHHLNAIFGYQPLLIRKELTF